MKAEGNSPERGSESGTESVTMGRYTPPTKTNRQGDSMNGKWWILPASLSLIVGGLALYLRKR